MRKYLSSILVAAALITGLQSCLKDKGFENNEYGLKDPAGQLAVSIPQAVDGISIMGVDFVNTSQTFKPLVVQLESANPAANDIHANLVLNNALVGDYNTANGTSFVILPTSAYNIPTLKITIPKGSHYASLNINVPNASTLNPLTTYALGFSLSSLDESGIAIPENMRNVVVQFSIKNKYDGKYNIKGFFVRTDAAGAAYNGPFSAKVEMQTTGAASVDMYYPAYGIVANPFNAGAFSNVGPRITFDLNTDKIVSIYNQSGGGAPAMTLIGTDNRYDASKKIIYLKYYYNSDPTNRIFSDTLTYTGPR